MQPGRPPRPQATGLGPGGRPLLLLTGFTPMQQRALTAAATIASNGVPVFAMPTTRPSIRPVQVSQRPRLLTDPSSRQQAVRQLVSEIAQQGTAGSRQTTNSTVSQHESTVSRPSSNPAVGQLSASPLQNQSFSQYVQAIRATSSGSGSTSTPGRPVSSFFIRPTTTVSTIRPLSAANLLRGSQTPRQVTPTVAVASTSTGTATTPQTSEAQLIANYSVVPPSVASAIYVAPGSAAPRRFPMKQANIMKILQERKAATKRKLDELVGGNNHDHPSWERKPDDMPLCPICFEVYKEAHVTKCGHTYCYECICQSIDFKPNCPSCSAMIRKDDLVPNFVVAQLIAAQKAKQPKTEAVQNDKGPSQLLKDMDVCKFITTRSNCLNLSDVGLMLTLLERRKEILTADSIEHQRLLLLEFLSQLYKLKQAEKSSVERQVSLLERDIKTIKESASTSEALKESSTVPESAKVTPNPSRTMRGFNTDVPHNDILSSSLASKKKRIHKYFDELVKLYLGQRNAVLFDDSPPEENDDSSLTTEDDYAADSSNPPTDPLNEFATTLSKISRYHALKPMATFSYSSDLLTNSNIVSSIEFDKDNEFFAIAGVTRKIKLFEYATVLGSTVDIHCPNSELSCGAKISCISWSGYFKNKLASSDYDGSVILWDTAVGSKINTFNEHERRVWSVDWSNGDPRLFASGSDDTKVKLWDLNLEKSVVTVESIANVCCVKFCPENTFHIAFGSADHCIHYYDFRNPKKAIGILEGHKKAVSYVKFASSMELVSASTDSNLKLWDLATFDEVHSFRGHINEKNFVGLATDGDYIACGSENNSVYVYYKKLPKPLFCYKFENYRSVLYHPVVDESAEFVSAVAWKKGSPVLVAANSQGAIKVLEMQS